MFMDEADANLESGMSTVPWHTLLEIFYGSVGDFLIAGFI